MENKLSPEQWQEVVETAIPGASFTCLSKYDGNNVICFVFSGIQWEVFDALEYTENDAAEVALFVELIRRELAHRDVVQRLKSNLQKTEASDMYSDGYWAACRDVLAMLEEK